MSNKYDEYKVIPVLHNPGDISYGNHWIFLHNY